MNHFLSDPEQLGFHRSKELGVKGVNDIEEQVDEGGVPISDNAVKVFDVGFGEMGFGENAVEDGAVEVSVVIGVWNG